MPSTKQLAAAAAIMAVGSAMPAQLDSRGAAAFSVEQVANPAYKGPEPGAIQVARMHAKYNKNGVPANIAAAASAAAGSVSATPGDSYDSEYISPVKIGSQTFQLDFDTGSSDLWVLGSGVSGASGHTTYTPGSTAKKASGETWSITYGDGSSASGDVYSDTVTIGGTTVTGQKVERATRASSAFTSGPNDGLVGLAFDSINTCSPQQCTTFVTNAINQGLPLPVFTAALKYHKAGTYDFGKIDSSKYTGSIAYTSVDTSQGFWQFTPSSYSIGSGSARSGSLNGIADTGTTLIYADDAVVSAYYAQVSGAKNSNTYGGYVFPCSATLPSFSLTIAGYKATVPGTYINYAPVTDGSSTCFGGIQSDDGIGFAIYGDVFLKSQFVVFDKGQTRLGFAKPSST